MPAHVNSFMAMLSRPVAKSQRQSIYIYKKDRFCYFFEASEPGFAMGAARLRTRMS